MVQEEEEYVQDSKRFIETRLNGRVQLKIKQ